MNSLLLDKDLLWVSRKMGTRIWSVLDFVH